MAFRGNDFHEGRRTKQTQRSESESYDTDEISSCSFEVESDDDLKNTNISQKRHGTSGGFKEKINTNEDTEEDSSDIIRPRRRSSILEYQTNFESRKGSNGFHSDGAFKHEENESPEILERKRKRKLSRRRRTENRSLETSKAPDRHRKKTSSRTPTKKLEVKDTSERSRKKEKHFHGKNNVIVILQITSGISGRKLLQLLYTEKN